MLQPGFDSKGGKYVQLNKIRDFVTSSFSEFCHLPSNITKLKMSLYFT